VGWSPQSVCSAVLFLEAPLEVSLCARKHSNTVPFLRGSAG